MKSTSGIWEKNTVSKFYACFYVYSDNFKIGDEFVECRILKTIPEPYSMILNLSGYDDGMFCHIFECYCDFNFKNIKFGNLVTTFGGFKTYGI